MTRFLSSLALITFLLPILSPTQGQTMLDPGNSIFEIEDVDARLAELERSSTADAEAFKAKGLDYLLGRIALGHGRQGTAMAALHSASERRSALTPYALKHLSQNARSTGNLMLERIYLTELAIEFPESLPARGAVVRRSRNRLESGDAREAISLLQNVPYPTAPARKVKAGAIRDTQALLGEAYLMNGDHSQAKDIFNRLLNDSPGLADDAALTAVIRLDLIDGDGEAANPRLAEEEHLRRADVYMLNRQFVSARRHLEAVLAASPGVERQANAALQIARGLTQQAEFAEALKWFERILERYPESTAAKDALVGAASAYSRVGKPREAISRYERFIAKYPSDERLDRAYLNIIDVLRDQGSDIEALKWCVRVGEVFKGKLPEAIAVFTAARIYLAREEWENARRNLDSLTAFSQLGGTSVPGGTSRHEISFLKAFCLEQLGRPAEAVEIYLSIPDEREEYYGGKATERLQALGSDEISRPIIMEKVGDLLSGIDQNKADAVDRAKAILRLASEPELRKRALAVLRERGPVKVPELRTVAAGGSQPEAATKLLELGLYDEAASELEFAAAPPDPAVLPFYYHRGNRADKGVELLENAWKQVQQDHPLELLPSDQLRLLYPVPYRNALVTQAVRRGVDPRFMLAIMRQESRFDPEARSYASARGLMQFITDTSSPVGAAAGREDITADDLYEPSTSILLGSQYLSDLFTRFPNQYEAVAASYNGGPDNMARWLARSRSGLAERYVPEILYSQTKDYVFKVIANYRVYQFLYDADLRPRSE